MSSDWDRFWTRFRKELGLTNPMDRPAFRSKLPWWNEMSESIHYGKRAAHRPLGARDRVREALIAEIRERPDMTDIEIAARGRELDPERWPKADDWHPREAERKRIKRLRADADI